MGCGASTTGSGSPVKKYDPEPVEPSPKAQEEPAPSEPVPASKTVVVTPLVIPGETIEEPPLETITKPISCAVGTLPDGSDQKDLSEEVEGEEEGEEADDLESDSLDDLQAKKAQLSEMLELFEKLEAMQANAEAGEGNEAGFGAMMNAITEALAQMQPMGEIRVPTPKSRMPVLSLDADCAITKAAAAAALPGLEERLEAGASAADLLDAGMLPVLRWFSQHTELATRAIKSSAVGLVQLMAAVPVNVAVRDGEAHCEDEEELSVILTGLHRSFLACKALSSAEVLTAAVLKVPELLGVLLDNIVACEKAPNALHYLCRTVLVAAECCSSELVEALCEDQNRTRLAAICRMVHDIAVEELLRELLSGGTCQFVAVRVALADAGVINLLLHNYGLGDDCPPELVPDGQSRSWKGSTAVLSEMLWCADTIEAPLDALVAKAAPQLSHPQAAELLGAPLQFATESDLGLEGSFAHLPAFVEGFKGRMNGSTRLLCVEWFCCLSRKSWKAAAEVARSGALRACVAACKRRLGNTLLHVRTHNLVLSVLRHCIQSAESAEAAVAQLEIAELISIAVETTQVELRTFVVAWVRVLQEWSKTTPAVEEWVSAQQPQWSILEGWAENHPLMHRAVLVQMGLAQEEDEAVPTDSDGSPLVKVLSTDDQDFVPTAD